MTTTTPGSVGVLLYEGCTIVEVAEAATRLRRGGFEVHFVGVDDAIVLDQSGLRMAPDGIISELDPTVFRAILVPGGDTDSVIDDERVHAFLSGASKGDALMAGICAGVAVLAASAVTAQHQITHNYRSPWCPDAIAHTVAPLWTTSMVIDDRTVGVVRDRNVITALPNASIDFAMEICIALDVYTMEKAELIAAHLKGNFVGELYEE